LLLAAKSICPLDVAKMSICPLDVAKIYPLLGESRIILT